MQSKDVLLMANQTSGMLVLPLLEDLRTAALACPTDQGGNHAHWLLGHLVLADNSTLAMIGGDVRPDKDLEALFAGGTRPATDGEGYPPYDELLERLKSLHGQILAKLEGLTEEELDQESRGIQPELKPLFGTWRQVLLMRPIHWANHRGQLADCRRALGRAPIMM